MRKLLFNLLVLALLVSCAQQNESQNEPYTNRDLSMQQQESNDGIENIDKDMREDFLHDLRVQLGGGGPRTLSAGQINLVVDGVSLNIQPSPLAQNGTTYLPVRAISTHFGAGVWWNQESNTIGINKGETKIAFEAGSSIANVNGRQVTIPPSITVQDATFVPVRFISETFGYRVSWNSATSTVTIQTTPNTYTVVAGDTLWIIANRFGMTLDAIRTLNNLTTDVVHVGQVLTIASGNVETPTPSPNPVQTPQPAPAPTPVAGQTYKVVSGDNLSAIANRYRTTVTAIRTANNLSSDVIYVGQTLRIPTGNTTETAPPTTQGVTVTYFTYTIQSGDNAWNLSIRYGVPMLQLLKENNLTVNSPLSLGQKLRIPMYDVPVKQVVSSRHGELLDWWTEARYVFPIGREVVVTDFITGRTFKVRHTMGGNHADAEPPTAADAQIMKEIWGGNFSWTPRAVIITVGGRRLAAAMHSFPHADDSIAGNNYNGHFCIHFLNSTRHADGLVQESMQRQVRIAAGVQ